MIEAQTHRRFLKSHLPMDALPIYDEVRYIHVARDASCSWKRAHRGRSVKTSLAEEATVLKTYVSCRSSYAYIPQ